MSPGKGLTRRIESSLYELVRQGFSLSGKETNCCFLNLGNGRFADVSHTSGFGFDDDGRAIGLTDWDFDGDLDLWVVNRNGPMLRLLRNDLPPGSHFLMLRLQGTLCNRDAIGARVEVYLPGQHVPLLRTLRAGDGFLSQSTKWLHFGLGKHSRVEKVVVRWPHGKAETFSIAEVDRYYKLVQGAGRAQHWTPPTRRQVKLVPSPLSRPRIATPPRVVFPYRLGLPEISYRTIRGRPVLLDRLRGQPVLVVLWASWCQPCVKELKTLKEHYASLEEAGLQVLALSVDGLFEGDQKTLEQALATAKGWQLPFPVGEAPQETVDRLQALLEHAFVVQTTLTVPTSFLLDEQGKLVVLYRGGVAPERLAQDVALLGKSRAELQAAGFPFAGRWIKEPDFVVEAHYAKALVDQGKMEQAVQYVNRHRRRLRKSPFFPKLLTMIGDQLVMQRQFSQALPWLEEALQVDNSLVEAHLLSALCYANQKNFLQAVNSYRRALRLEPKRASAVKNLGWLLLVVPDPRVQDRKEGLELLLQAVQLAPEDAEAWDMLARAYLVQRQPRQALQTLSRAAETMEQKQQPEAAVRFRQMARQLRFRLKQQRSGN